MKDEKKKIGEMLMEAGFVNEWQIKSALGEQKRWGGRLASIMVSMGFVNEKTIASVLEKQIGEKCISLDDKEIATDVLGRMKVDIAKKYSVIPVDFDKGTLIVATSDPTDLNVLDELAFILNVRIKPALALDSGIRRAIARHYEGRITESKVPPVMGEKTGQMELTSGVLGKLSPGAATSVGQPAEEKDVATKTLIEALLALLIEKGVVTREELMKKLKEKERPG